MTRRKSMIGALVLCALSLCAFGAANASAAKGLTATTCTEVKAGTGNYTTATCETKLAGSNFETTAIPLNETTEVTATAVGNSILRATIATVKVEVVCAKAETEASIKNSEPAALEHRITVNKLTVDYKECFTALQSNTEKRCEVESISGTAGIKGTIKTNPLKSVSGNETMAATLEPEGETNFAEFKVLAGECGIGGVTVKVTGKVIGIADEGKPNHTTFTPATNGTELKANGGAATYEGTNATVMKGTTNRIGAETFT